MAITSSSPNRCFTWELGRAGELDALGLPAELIQLLPVLGGDEDEDVNRIEACLKLGRDFVAGQRLGKGERE